MIKVKAYIADLVLCVHDPDPIIARMSRTFFHELAQKGTCVDEEKVFMKRLPSSL